MPVSYILYWTLGTVLKTRIFQKRFFVWELFVSVALQLTAWVYRTLFLWGAQSAELGLVPLHFPSAGRVLPPSSGALRSRVAATQHPRGLSERRSVCRQCTLLGERLGESGTRNTCGSAAPCPRVDMVLISLMERAYQFRLLLSDDHSVSHNFKNRSVPGSLFYSS